MNLDIIDHICEKFKKYSKQGLIDYMPKFGMITNGTIINEKILSLIKKHISFITVSIDGPKEINDKNRVFIDGSGSYDKIAKFIETIKKETKISIAYEATYTKYHLAKKIKISDLKIFFADRFEIDGIIADELSLENTNYTEYRKMFDFYKTSDIDFLNLPEGFWSILYSIANKSPKDMCQIYRKTIAISTKGDIYPCHMDTGNDNLKLGNINEENVYTNFNIYKKTFPILSIIHSKEQLCKNCWTQNICGGCTRLRFFDNQNNKYNTIPNKKICFSNQKHIEKILLLIAHMHKDANKWDKFLNYINQKNKSVTI